MALSMRLLQLVVLDDDRLDAEAGLELDLVDRVQVGRIGDRQEQPLAAPEQRQHAVLGEQLVADQPDGLEVEVDRVQVEQRHAEFVGGGDGDVARIGGAARDQLGDDAGLALARRLAAPPAWPPRRPRRPAPGAAAGRRGRSAARLSAKEALSFMDLRQADSGRERA